MFEEIGRSDADAVNEHRDEAKPEAFAQMGTSPDKPPEEELDSILAELVKNIHGEEEIESGDSEVVKAVEAALPDFPCVETIQGGEETESGYAEAKFELGSAEQVMSLPDIPVTIELGLEEPART